MSSFQTSKWHKLDEISFLIFSIIACVCIVSSIVCVLGRGFDPCIGELERLMISNHAHGVAKL